MNLCKFKGISAVILSTIMIFSNAVSSFGEINEQIILPKSIENGSFAVSKGDTVLKNGDTVSEGDSLTFNSTPNNDYTQVLGTESGTNVLYNISTNTSKYGNVEVAKSSLKDEEVTIKALPNENSRLDDISITDTDGENIAYTAVDDNTYVFIMPDKDVFVNVKFYPNYRAIILPENVENGSFTVTRGGELLKDGDTVDIGDELVFTSTPNEKFMQITGTQNGTKTLEFDDFVSKGKPVRDIKADGWTEVSESTPYYGKTEGYSITIPRTDVSTKAASTTLTNTDSDTEYALNFDWSINQNSYNYGRFDMELYHNGNQVVAIKLNEYNENPEGNMLHGRYKFVGTGNDTFEWRITRTRHYVFWADEGGRKAYLGNINLQSSKDAAIYEPEPPVFAAYQNVNIAADENAVITVDKPRTIKGENVTVTVDANANYYLSKLMVKDSVGKDIDTVQKDNTFSFVMPEGDVFVSADIRAFAVYDDSKYITISNADELYSFAAYINNINSNANGILINDIVINQGDVLGCNGIKAEDWREWTPIGNTERKYVGTFKGEGHTISGLFCKSSDSYAGLFGYIDEWTVIEKVGLINSYIEGNDYVGGIAGISRGGNIYDCYTDAAVKATGYEVGGIAGENDVVEGTDNGTISNCYNLGKIDGSLNRGGIVGFNGGKVKACINLGYVSPYEESTGSIAGYNSGEITNCYYGDDTCDKGVGSVSLFDNISDVSSIKQAEIESGNVTWLLSNKTDEDTHWVQTLGKDSMPLLKAFASDSLPVVELTEKEDNSIIYANVLNDGISIVKADNSFYGISVDSEVYGGEGKPYLEGVDIAVNGALYELTNFSYSDNDIDNRYAVFPVVSSTEAKSADIRGKVSIKDTADSDAVRHFVTNAINAVINADTK